MTRRRDTRGDLSRARRALEMEAPDPLDALRAETVATLAGDLRLAITTASNDDLSEVGSDKRTRHTGRIEAMERAAEFIEKIALALTQGPLLQIDVGSAKSRQSEPPRERELEPGEMTRPQVQAASFDVMFCGDPNCGPHVILLDEAGEPIAEAVMSKGIGRKITDLEDMREARLASGEDDPSRRH